MWSLVNRTALQHYYYSENWGYNGLSLVKFS